MVFNTIQEIDSFIKSKFFKVKVRFSDKKYSLTVNEDTVVEVQPIYEYSNLGMYKEEQRDVIQISQVVSSSSEMFKPGDILFRSKAKLIEGREKERYLWLDTKLYGYTLGTEVSEFRCNNSVLAKIFGFTREF